MAVPGICKGHQLMRTFVVPHAETLTSIIGSEIRLALNSHIKLPNLQLLDLSESLVEGWESLCESLTSLKHLILDYVQFVGTSSENILSGIPLPTLNSLESLVISGVEERGERMIFRLDAVAASLSNLHKLKTDAVSVVALMEILMNCPNLTWIVLQGPLTNEHLQIFSKLAKAPLETLSLRWGQFTKDELIVFAGSFRASVKHLEFESCTGLTPSSLRTLLQLPVQKLYLKYMYANPGHFEEFDRISKAEKPRCLKEFTFIRK